ncbi:MAG: DNA helicase, partial [Candidatus Nanopelagicales bacterium]
DDEKTYLHRIGRTGRAGASGVAVTLVDWEDIARWQMIDKILGLPFKDPLETYSTSDHVYTGLGVPRDVTGRLAKDKQTRAGLEAEEVEDLGETGRKKPAEDRPRQARSSSRGREAGRDRAARPASTTTADAPRSTKPRRRRRTKRGGSPTQGEAQA